MEERRKYLTESELARLLKVIQNPRDRAIFLVSYWRGLRASEVGMLPLSAWDQGAGRLHVKRLKHSLAGNYLLSPAETRALRAWLKVRGSDPGPLFLSRHGRGVSRQMLDVLMRKYGAAAMLPAHLRHFHVLKHSIGTHLVGRGQDLYAVKDWLGHRDFKSTLVYAQIRNQQRDDAARRVYDEAA